MITGGINSLVCIIVTWFELGMFNGLNDNVCLQFVLMLRFFVPSSSTVMYEMLTGRWPYAGYAAETLIYMVSTGFRQSLDKIDCPKQLKVFTCDLAL